MKTNPIILMAVLATVLLPAAPVVLADGMFVAPEGMFIYEPAQQAILHYDSETQREQLTILPYFNGNATSFAWVVPVPNQPEITLADQQVFLDLDSITQAVYQSREGDWDCYGQRNMYADYPAAGNDAQIEVISDELVGYYHTMVVSATETTALMDSLTAWGFLHQENTAAVFDALDYYVNKGWYFAAMKVDTDELRTFSTKSSDPYYSYWGGLDPVKFSFVSDEIIYPMRISALSAYDYTRVNIYAITDHRMDFPGAQTFYANKFSTSEIGDLSNYPALAGLFQPGDFMTKLTRGYTPVEMVEDVVLVRAENDHEFIQINYSNLPWTSVLLFGPAAVWAAIRRRKLLGG